MAPGMYLSAQMSPDVAFQHTLQVVDISCVLSLYQTSAEEATAVVVYQSSFHTEKAIMHGAGITSEAAAIRYALDPWHSSHALMRTFSVEASVDCYIQRNTRETGWDCRTPCVTSLH